MKEQQFVEVHEPQWQALEHFFWQRERGTRQQALLTDFPPAYRALCEQLVYAENAGFSPALLVRCAFAASRHAGASVVIPPSARQRREGCRLFFV